MSILSATVIYLEYASDDLVWSCIPAYDPLLKIAKKRNNYNADFFTFLNQGLHKQIKVQASVSLGAQDYKNLLIELL